MSINIAIDGPAGCGKSTVAKEISAKLGILYLDTGSMYRGVAYTAKDIPLDKDNEDFINFLMNMKIEIEYNNGKIKLYINGSDVYPYLRTKEVALLSSKVAKIQAVREKLVAFQKDFAKNNDVVMDGRDIGTVVMPNSPYKFFLTASIEERAKRRYLEEKNTGITLEEIKEDISKRDYNDKNRKHSPLVMAKDATLIDTSELSIDQVVSKILDKVK